MANSISSDSALQQDLDSPARFEELSQKIQTKASLRLFYNEVYRIYRECIEKAPPGGILLELGSGGGFAKQLLPKLTTSDVIAYKGVDLVIDATQMNLADRSVSAISMLNVFHHIPDVEKFLNESVRVLLPGGRIIMVDQNVGPLSSIILKYLHSEPFDSKTTSWKFNSTGPLSGANGALAWIVFERDRELFHQKFPQLKIVRYQKIFPLYYWLSGGLKSWTLVPSFLAGAVKAFDLALGRMFPSLCTFVAIELVKDSAATPKDSLQE